MIIFDLDGTLIDTKSLHQASFQWALQQEDPTYFLSDEHRDLLEGIPSLNKIAFLQQNLGWQLDANRMYVNKQAHTLAHLETTAYSDRFSEELRKLSRRHTLCLASNARSQFVFKVLHLMGLDSFTIVLTASYIPLALAKPNPYIFTQCMQLTNEAPADTIIFEDSDVGLAAARASGAGEIIQVENSLHTLSKIEELLCR